MKTMKNIILLLLLISCTAVFAQNRAWQNVFGKLDKINPDYLKELEAVREFKSDDTKIIESVDDGRYFTNHKSGKKHNKVVFNHYQTGKIFFSQ